jgi:hypothetical protein
MVSHPVEANFYVHVSDAEGELTFAPTRSRYIYSRLVDTVDLSPNPVVRHAGRRCDIGGYEPVEVQAMAHRVVLATMRRLMRSSTRGASRRLLTGTLRPSGVHAVV